MRKRRPQIGFDDQGRALFQCADGDVSHSDDPYEGLPEQFRLLARVLKRLDGHFEDGVWPATWTPLSHVSPEVIQSKGKRGKGWDLSVVVLPHHWAFGFDFPSDRDCNYHNELWQDYCLVLGPVVFVLHRWWYAVRD